MTDRHKHVYFITHPNVVISRDVPVPRWPLSETGIRRMRAALNQTWVNDITAIYCSTEQKAIDGANILASHLTLRPVEVELLGENDRSSTGFLPPEEFERMADEFFSRPDQSARGWERAVGAQKRIVETVHDIVSRDTSAGSIAIVSHGAVGTLLYCHLSGQPISRQWDQPANGGGNYYRFSRTMGELDSWWRPVNEFG